jgi:glycosyltransferase involved in cell wall biosynthesis
MSAERVILLLGRRDHPTDGVADYCEKLREYGAARGLSFESVQVGWAEKGWRAALAELRAAATAWRDRWVFLQFTTLAWSHRGFPLRAPSVLDVLRQCGARPGVVFHDFAPLTGSGIVAVAREFCQLRVLRQLYERSDLAIFTIPVKNISWLPMRRDHAVFIPVGPNCPEASPNSRFADGATKTIAVYGVTGGSQTLPEVADIAYVVKQVILSAGPLRLLVFGRGSREAETALGSALAGANVEIETLGLVSPEQVPQTLARADALLFVRGHISSRRGSAIAGIASGLPVVCYSGPDTDWPVTEAGILGVPMGDRQALAAALENVLSDTSLRSTLARRSREAHEEYFSWAAITARFAAEIGKPPAEQERELTKGTSGSVRVA